MSQIYNTIIVKSIMTYGFAVWGIRKCSISKLLITELDFWQDYLGETTLCIQLLEKNKSQF